MTTIKDIHLITGFSEHSINMNINRKLIPGEDYRFIQQEPKGRACKVLTQSGMYKLLLILKKNYLRKEKNTSQPSPEWLALNAEPPKPVQKVSELEPSEYELKKLSYLEQLNILPFWSQPENIKKRFIANLRLKPVMREILFN